MKILVLNSGSSSIKFKLYNDDKAVALGLVEKIGENTSKVELKNLGTDEKFIKEQAIKNHEEGLDLALRNTGFVHFLQLGPVGQKTGSKEC